MSPKDLYLIAYNAACCLGWALVLELALNAVLISLLSEGNTLVEALSTAHETRWLAEALFYTQGAALLEIVHAMVGLVRSPVLVTSMQVMSRSVALIAVTYSSPAQTQPGAAVMILSWSMVEVPRYAFYVAALLTGDATKKTPYPLFWLRYSLFAILYPTGIMGELSVFRAAAQDDEFAVNPFISFFYGTFLPVIYVFGSPFMIYNMAMNRKSAMKKRFAKPPPPAKGLCWPVDAKGQRSSTDTNKAILAAALQPLDESKARAALAAKSWRFNYVRHLQTLVELQCASPQAALESAQAGLSKAYELFEFVVPNDDKASSLQQAMDLKNKNNDPPFFTGYVQGKQPKADKLELKVPYKDQVLSGQELKDQVQKWVDYGTIEPSAGQAICQCVDHPEWLMDFQKRYFCLLGAGSAMGPLKVLLALGANVIAIDLDRPAIWQNLMDMVENSSGSMTFPMSVDPKTCSGDNNKKELAAHAGCNLFTDTPRIRDWLLKLYPGKPFTVGSYAYLDGALHVQVSLAMDAISRDLSEQRPNTSLAYLCTPTDLHLIPQQAHDAAQENYNEYQGRLYCMLMRFLSSGKYLRKNINKPIPGKGGDYYLANGISVAQGPNYALAKRLQHWRAIIARSKGCTVSSNVAPSTSTASVVHNRTFAWAYQGMPYFKPFEIFAPDTSKAVMLALLAYDLNDTSSVANPKTELGNPNQLFSYDSFHGGVWRCAYQVDSIGEASVFLYFGRVARPYLMVASAVGAAAAAMLWQSQ